MGYRAMLTQRSQQKELLDFGADYYNLSEYQECLRNLFTINKLLRFFGDTVRIMQDLKSISSVLDIGCGSGLFLLKLNRYFPDTYMLGIDNCTEAIKLAQQELQCCQDKNIHKKICFKLQDQAQLAFSKKQFDVILATLVCHHLTDEELICFLIKVKSAIGKVIIINELHRHPIAYWLYKKLSPLLFSNRLIIHDGLISIRRGFTRAEWYLLLQKAGITHFRLNWRFPFRWQIVIWNP